MFRGTLTECIQHFATAHPDNFALRELLAEFTSVTKRTAYQWFFDEGQMPSAERLVAARVFFELCGYTIREHEGMSDSQKRCIRIVGHKLVNIDDLTQLFDVTTRRSTLDYFTARRAIPDNKLELLDLIIGEHGEELKKKESAWKRRIRAVLPSKECETKATAAEEIIPISDAALKEMVQEPHLDHQLILETLAHLVLAARPLAQTVVSDQFTPEERDQLRALCNRNGVFELKNALVGLCGERARNEAT